MGLEDKNGLNDSAHANKLDFSKDPEGQMEVPDKQAMPEYVGKGECHDWHVQLHWDRLRMPYSDRLTTRNSQ